MRILLTGATGYVGRSLLPRLEEAGHEVRCLARRPGKLAGTSASIGYVAPGVVKGVGNFLHELCAVETGKRTLKFA